MVSVQGCTDMTDSSAVALRVSCTASCHPPTVLSPSAARLLLALDQAGGFLPTRQATRAMWPDGNIVLPSSERSSAAKASTRLQVARFIERRAGDVWLTARSRALLEWQHARLERAAMGRLRGR